MWENIIINLFIFIFIYIPIDEIKTNNRCNLSFLMYLNMRIKIIKFISFKN